MKIGIIGLGDMGKLYAKAFAAAGMDVCGCDLYENVKTLNKELIGSSISVLDSIKDVTEQAQVIVFSVGIDQLQSVVEQVGKVIQPHSLVIGQCAVKTIEIEAFERYLPEETQIVSCHSLHGPYLSSKGQSLAVIRYRCSDETFPKAIEILEALGSKIIEIENYKHHDQMMADTQAVTHLGFLSMGTAWKNAGFFPWENEAYFGGLDSVKILLMLRIYAGRCHVYSDLAIRNPWAKRQVSQYALSASELFKLMIQEDEKGLRDRVMQAKRVIFDKNPQKKKLLDQKTLEKIHLSGPRKLKSKPNSHLSLLAMVDAWSKLEINPYQHLICQTPLYRLRLGIVEHLYSDDELLEQTVNTALCDRKIRGDDLEFHTAVSNWSSLIENEDTQAYQKCFEETKIFFRERLEEGLKKSNELIKKFCSGSD